MLNKDICKKCHNERYKMTGWIRNDEYRWEKGNLMCDGKTFRKITGSPPEFCKYYMEQIINAK